MFRTPVWKNASPALETKSLGVAKEQHQEISRPSSWITLSIIVQGSVADQTKASDFQN